MMNLINLILFNFITNCLIFFSASITILICPIGLILIGILTDRYGRKLATQIAFVPIIISWLVITYADSYHAILIGKIIFGVPFGK